MGSGTGTSQAAAHDRNNDVHVRKLSPNLQHHDGGYGV
jgi:hypothetical protein